MERSLINSTTRKILLEKSNDLIIFGNLTIFCEVETYGNIKELSGRTCIGQPLNDKEKLLDDMKELFMNKALTDVTFNVDGRQFRAHKLIMAARSPVFAAMFQHSTSKENVTGIVDIPDIEANVFEELLRYIYTGQVPLKRMDEVAAGLLAAADKYLLEKLKKACGDHLVSKISPVNCVQLLSLGKNDPVYYLRKEAVDYICRFPTEVYIINISFILFLLLG